MPRPKPGRPSLLQPTVSALQAAITRNSATFMPPTRTVARALGVSPATLMRAAAMLCAQGILDYGPGRRMRVVGRAAPPADVPSRAPSVSRVKRVILGRIETGTWRVGRALPKIRTLRAELGVSDKTVTAALRALAETGFVHANGRTWVVGSPPAERQASVMWSPPAVLLVQQHVGSWKSMGSADRTARFCATVNEGIEERGILMAPVLAQPPGSPAPVPVDAGLDRARAIARGLDTRYQGALVACSAAELPDLRGWLGALAALGRPVAWFDRYDERRHRLAAASSRRIYRCAFSEQAGLRCALEYLSAMGHRKIAYVNPLPMRGEDWKLARGDLLARTARRAGTIAVARYPSAHRLARHCPAKLLHRAIAGLFARNAPILSVFRYFLARYDRLSPAIARFGLPSAADPVGRVLTVARFMALGGGRLARPLEVAANSPASTARKVSILREARVERIDSRYAYDISVMLHMLYALADPQTTAVIVPSDSEAVLIYRWLHLAGRRVPDDISLLSFDNSPGLQPYPIDSLDFGFGHLGYCALHALLGDIPIGRDRHGNVPARPRVVQRGSVRPNRTGPD